MSRIKDEFLEIVIYLYPNRQDAEVGTNKGASGFVVLIEFIEIKGLFHTYAVTARHVVGGMQQCPVLRINTIEGGLDIIETAANDWMHHPEPECCDLSICLLKDTHKIKGIKISDFITQDIIKEKHIGLGDNVFMIGRFSSWDGGTVNLPSLRYGRISIMPLQSVHHSLIGNRQESFLVEMQSLNGYSGSATFLHIPPLLPRPPFYHYDCNSEYQGLLGIDWGHLKMADHTNSGMACIIPAWKLKDFLFSKEVIEQRLAIETEREKT